MTSWKTAGDNTSYVNITKRAKDNGGWLPLWDWFTANSFTVPTTRGRNYPSKNGSTQLAEQIIAQCNSAGGTYCNLPYSYNGGELYWLGIYSNGYFPYTFNASSTSWESCSDTYGTDYWITTVGTSHANILLVRPL